MFSPHASGTRNILRDISSAFVQTIKTTDNRFKSQIRFMCRENNTKVAWKLFVSQYNFQKISNIFFIT